MIPIQYCNGVTDLTVNSVRCLFRFVSWLVVFAMHARNSSFMMSYSTALHRGSYPACSDILDAVMHSHINPLCRQPISRTMLCHCFMFTGSLSIRSYSNWHYFASVCSRPDRLQSVSDGGGVRRASISCIAPSLLLLIDTFLFLSFIHVQSTDWASADIR